jgi:hypothetical protein
MIAGSKVMITSRVVIGKGRPWMDVAGRLLEFWCPQRGSKLVAATCSLYPFKLFLLIGEKA